MANRYNKKYFTEEERKTAIRLKSKDYSKKFRLANPEKVKSWRKKSLSKQQSWRKKIIERDGAFCSNCGIKERLTLQHIIPECIGGEFSYENLKILCLKCNIKDYHQLVKKALILYFRK